VRGKVSVRVTRFPKVN